jgi:hypothetical protein
MARNGSGTYNRAVSPYTAGTTITAATVNQEMDDIATALTGSMARDGQSPATANIPMGGFRLTGLGNAIASTDAATLGQITAAQAGAVAKAGDTMTGALNFSSGALNFAPWVDLASAATTDIGAQTSNNVRITGTTTITSLGTAASGVTRQLRFAGALTLTYNATSLILPGGANIVTMAGDTATAISLGSGNWVVTDYMRALAFGGYQQIQRQTVSAVSAVDFTLPSGFQNFELIIESGRVSISGSSLLLRCGVGASFDSGASDYIYGYLTHTGSSFIGGSNIISSAIDLTGSLAINDTRAITKTTIIPGTASTTFLALTASGVIEVSSPSWRVINFFSGRVAIGAKTSIRILASGGANISGTFTLLGIPS